MAELGASLGLTVVRGSQNDVLARFMLALQRTDAPVLVRITGDCPFVDPGLLDEMIRQFNDHDIDYLTNSVPPTYPDGLDVEIFNRESLLLADAECNDPFQREHVTPWMRDSGRCRLGQKKHQFDCSSMRWTVDETEDYS